MRRSFEIGVLLTLLALSGCTLAQAPFAFFVASPTLGEAPLKVSFNASGSSDPDGTIAQYEWDFNNDGTVDATGVTTTHTYSLPGLYTAVLTVTDNTNLKSKFTLLITVLETTIFFSRWDGGSNFGIFRMNTNGTALTQLTMGIDAWPAVAPNGRQLVAFARDMDPDPAVSQFDIFSMLPNGTMQTSSPQRALILCSCRNLSYRRIYFAKRSSFGPIKSKRDAYTPRSLSGRLTIAMKNS